MFYTLRSQKLRLDQIDINSKKLRKLNITNNNAKKLRVVSELFKEVDIDRHELLFAEWDLKPRYLEIGHSGRNILVQPERSKNRLKLKSHVKAETTHATIDGDVTQWPKRSVATVVMKEKIRSTSEILSLKVHRYNELNHLFDRRAKFFMRILGNPTANYNC